MPYPFAAVPGTTYNMPSTLLGPTGMVFVHPKGYSTHLNMITSDIPNAPGKYSIVPMLVPGQVHIDRLLAGEKPTDVQNLIAVKYAAQNPKYIVGSFDKLPEAEAYEKQWHDAVSAQHAEYLSKGVAAKGQK